MISDSETQYSSSVAKLLHLDKRMHYPLYPYTLQLALTDQCNLNCSFCSVRDRAQKRLDFEQIRFILNHPIFSQLRGVELTGGGEPSLWEGIDDLIMELHHRRLAVGLITNGVATTRRISTAALSTLTWIRVSLNGLDVLQDIDLSGIPARPTLGFSYVLNQFTKQSTLDKVGEYVERFGAKYVRIVRNCLELDKPQPLFAYPPKAYIQSKVFGNLKPIVPCRMGYLKPYLNTDAHFYWCSGVCLETRRFPEEYRMGRYDEIDAIWLRQKPFACSFSKCFWVDHNVLLDQANTPIQHEQFI